MKLVLVAAAMRLLPVGFAAAACVGVLRWPTAGMRRAPVAAQSLTDPTSSPSAAAALVAASSLGLVVRSGSSPLPPSFTADLLVVPAHLVAVSPGPLFEPVVLAGPNLQIKTSRVKYPEGWDLIEPTLRDLEAKMREAENDPHDGKRKCEALWPIFRISHQKSRYIYDLYYRKKEISKELYEFCLDQGYADRNLIAKWKKPGYERLCCLRCIQTRDHNFATTCVCRVPKHLREEKVIECVHCGCRGCASGD
ncbi:hypothetical protein EJB05_35899, partial [Eragrostis curvula]